MENYDGFIPLFLLPFAIAQSNIVCPFNDLVRWVAIKNIFLTHL